MQELLFPALEAALNAALHTDEATLKRLDTLQGEVILLNIEDWNIEVYLIPSAQRLALHKTLDQAPTTTISGKLDAFLQLSRANASTSALFKNHIEITGNIETGEKLREILHHLDFDWEEKLSQLTGDYVADKVGTLAKQIKSFSERSSDVLAKNLSAYLQDELRVLPTRIEVEHFSEQVAVLRDAVERLEARLDLLDNKGEHR